MTLWFRCYYFNFTYCILQLSHILIDDEGKVRMTFFVDVRLRLQCSFKYVKNHKRISYVKFEKSKFETFFLKINHTSSASYRTTRCKIKSFFSSKALLKISNSLMFADGVFLNTIVVCYKEKRRIKINTYFLWYIKKQTQSVHTNGFSKTTEATQCNRWVVDES